MSIFFHCRDDSIVHFIFAIAKFDLCTVHPGLKDKRLRRNIVVNSLNMLTFSEMSSEKFGSLNRIRGVDIVLQVLVFEAFWNWRLEGRDRRNP